MVMNVMYVWFTASNDALRSLTSSISQHHRRHTALEKLKLLPTQVDIYREDDGESMFREKSTHILWGEHEHINIYVSDSRALQLVCIIAYQRNLYHFWCFGGVR